ncbi:hypothetical protein K457DRAFT_1882856 [Linnemannia elongata AG-77]|uniref:Uncharacterized protein n=1 Tax=Linnemannia elongata AG-77 TaxID=1314771 RepID=A0A197JC07_9FUNG|nr:hypothetical protein K457DRAFT_1882856 [Linnemannia elongata AG-77]
MRGLVMENHVGMEPDPENDALVALIRRLRPDVAQKQSFGGYLPYLANTNFGYLNRSTRTTSRSRLRAAVIVVWIC